MNQKLLRKKTAVLFVRIVHQKHENELSPFASHYHIVITKTASTHTRAIKYNRILFPFSSGEKQPAPLAPWHKITKDNVSVVIAFF